MTTTESTKTIAGITNVELTEEEARHARAALAHFASKWVDEIAINIMSNADAIIANPALRIMVTKWHEAEQAYQNKRRTALVQMGLDNAYPIDLETIDLLYHREARIYSEALHELLCK